MPSSGRRAEDLIADLIRLRGARCADCGAPLCGHHLLFAFVLGTKSAPRCPVCLATALERDPEDLARQLGNYVARRDCYLGAWRWTSFVEETCPQAGRVAADAAGGDDDAEDETDLAGIAMSAPPARVDAEWDAGDMACGDLVMELRGRMRALAPRQLLRVIATDPGAPVDLPAWCRLTRHPLIHARHPVYFIQRKEE